MVWTLKIDPNCGLRRQAASDVKVQKGRRNLALGHEVQAKWFKGSSDRGGGKGGRDRGSRTMNSLASLTALLGAPGTGTMRAARARIVDERQHAYF